MPVASPPARTGEGGGGRNPALDGVRGLAVTLLLLAHLLVLDTSRGWMETAAASAIRMSWICIDIFFCLSAFLITRILLDTRESPDYIRSFFGRRFLRIIPLYYLVLFMFFVVVPRLDLYEHGRTFWLHGRENSLWYWLFGENLRIAVQGDYAHEHLSIAWTLSVEEQFYILWPWLVAWLRPSAMARLCVLLVGAALAARLSLAALGAGPKVLHTFTLCRMDGIALGAYIAIMSRTPGWIERWKRRMPALFAGLAVALAAGAVFVRFTEPSPKFTEFVYSRFFQGPGYSISVAFAGVLVFLAAFGEPAGMARRVFCSRPLQIAGAYSYGLYLLHGPVRYLLHRHGVFSVSDHMDRPWAAQLLNYLVVGGASLLAAWGSWHLVEAPALRLKRWFPYRRGKAAVLRPGPEDGCILEGEVRR